MLVIEAAIHMQPTIAEVIDDSHLDSMGASFEEAASLTRVVVTGEAGLPFKGSFAFSYPVVVNSDPTQYAAVGTFARIRCCHLYLEIAEKPQ